MISDLVAVHSSQKMISFARASKGVVRKDAIDSLHPIVRVHPVSGEKSLFLNEEFFRGIVGMKDQESEMLLKFLINHICMGHDFQARVQWERYSVVMFDGRTTLRKSSSWFLVLTHVEVDTFDRMCVDTATMDYDSRIQARHIFRLASMTEVPIPVNRK